ncbi:MAG: hypothetical protein JWR79_911, partial [Tardiphaga sp.]|nr:hypothetical protein [Tardiphaga sp.]
MSASTTGFGRPSRRSLLIGGVAALGALPLISRNAKAAEWPTRPV